MFILIKPNLKTPPALSGVGAPQFAVQEPETLVTKTAFNSRLNAHNTALTHTGDQKPGTNNPCRLAVNRTYGAKHSSRKACPKQ